MSADLVDLEEIDIIRLLGHTEVPDAIDLASQAMNRLISSDWDDGRGRIRREQAKQAEGCKAYPGRPTLPSWTSIDVFVLVMGRGFSLYVSVVAGRVAAIAEDLVENIVGHFNYYHC